MFTRLDESSLFREQAQIYERLGMRAWSEGLVPWRITSTPLMGEVEAELITAFEADVRSSGALGEAARLTVIDVGAGNGRAGFHLARALESLGSSAQIILTDVAAGNVTALQRQPQLEALRSRDRVAFAHFDALEPSTPFAAPAVLLAHYLFDSLPHRAFRQSAGAISEGWVEVDGETWRWEFRPASLPSEVRLPGDGTFLVPVGARQALASWSELLGGPLLVLAADKGVEARGVDEAPLIARHESISAGVDFGLLAGALPQWRHFQPSTPETAFGLHAFATRSVDLPTFSAQWSRDRGSEALRLMKAVNESSGAPHELLSLVERSRFDPDVLAQLAPHFLAARLEGAIARQLVAAIARAAQNHFIFHQHLDVPFNLAALAHHAGALELAVALYVLSLQESGPHVSTLLNLGHAQAALGRSDAAREAFDAVLELEHGQPKAVAALKTLANDG